jgi:hypothetical protein
MCIILCRMYVEHPLTIEQFLSKLPSKVVKNSKLMAIRADVSHILTGNKMNEMTAADEPVMASDTEENVIVSNEDLTCSSSVMITNREDKTAMIKVKWLTNSSNISNSTANKTYVFKMKYTDTLMDLKNLVKSQR